MLELAERFEWRWFAALIASFAMSLLAGFPQEAAVVVASRFLLALLMSYRVVPAMLAAGVVFAKAAVLKQRYCRGNASFTSSAMGAAW